MTQDDTDLLAAEFVLGTLDGEARARFSRDLAADDALQGAVRDWERRLAPLADDEAPVPPRPDVWAAIEAGLDETADIVGTTTIRAPQGEWQTVMPGVELKILAVDREAGMQSALMRMAPGATIDVHEHKKAEECYVIDGSVTIGDFVLHAGDYHLAHADTTHPPIVSREGCLVFLRSEIYEFAA